jgi:hypothetical protein
LLFRLHNTSQGQIELGILRKVQIPDNTPIWRARRTVAQVSVSSYLIPHSQHVDVEFNSLEECLLDPQIRYFKDSGRLRVTPVFPEEEKKQVEDIGSNISVAVSDDQTFTESSGESFTIASDDDQNVLNPVTFSEDQVYEELRQNGGDPESIGKQGEKLAKELISKRKQSKKSK